MISLKKRKRREKQQNPEPGRKKRRDSGLIILIDTYRANGQFFSGYIKSVLHKKANVKTSKNDSQGFR